MTELEVDATSFTDPREWKRVMLDSRQVGCQLSAITFRLCQALSQR